MKKIAMINKIILCIIFIVSCITCPINIKKSNAYYNYNPSCLSLQITYDYSHSRCDSPYYYPSSNVYVNVYSYSRTVSISPGFGTKIKSISSYSYDLSCYSFLNYCKINTSNSGYATISISVDQGWYYGYSGILLKNPDKTITQFVSWGSVNSTHTSSTTPQSSSSFTTPTKLLDLYKSLYKKSPNTKKVVKLIKEQIKSVKKEKNKNQVDTITCKNKKQKTFDIAKYLKTTAIGKYVTNHLCLESGFKRVDIHYFNGKGKKFKKVIIKY